MTKNKIYLMLNYITVILFVYLTLYRFRFKMPYEIFENPRLSYLVVYSFIIILNSWFFIITYLLYKKVKLNIKKDTIINKAITKIKHWMDLSFSTVIEYLAGIPGAFNIILSYIIHYYIKIPLTCLQFFAYGPRILLHVTLGYDILFIATFKYSYNVLYLLLLTLLFKTLTYLSIAVNNKIFSECTNSLTIIDYNLALEENQDAPVNYDNYRLSDSNLQFTTVKQVFDIANITAQELHKLHIIDNNTKMSQPVQLMSRLYYIILFSYIVYYYPISLF